MGRTDPAVTPRLPRVPEVRDNSVFQRIGLSVVTSKDDFEERSKRDVASAEADLEAIRKRAQMQAAQWVSHLDVAAEEARAEERKMISVRVEQELARAEEERRRIQARVEQELAAFREEQRRKQQQEEERLAHLYRAMIAPMAKTPPPPAPAPAPPTASTASGGYSEDFESSTPIIYSLGTLATDDDSGERTPQQLPHAALNVNLSQVPRYVDVAAPSSSSAIPSHRSHGGSRSGSRSRPPQSCAVADGRHEAPELSHRSHGAAGSRSGSRGRPPPQLQSRVVGEERNEAQELLEKNLARLKLLDNIVL